MEDLSNLPTTGPQPEPAALSVRTPEELEERLRHYERELHVAAATVDAAIDEMASGTALPAAELAATDVAAERVAGVSDMLLRAETVVVERERDAALIIEKAEAEAASLLDQARDQIGEERVAAEADMAAGRTDLAEQLETGREELAAIQAMLGSYRDGMVRTAQSMLEYCATEITLVDEPLATLPQVPTASLPPVTIEVASEPAEEDALPVLVDEPEEVPETTGPQWDEPEEVPETGDELHTHVMQEFADAADELEQLLEGL